MSSGHAQQFHPCHNSLRSYNRFISCESGFTPVQDYYLVVSFVRVELGDQDLLEKEVFGIRRSNCVVWCGVV